MDEKALKAIEDAQFLENRMAMACLFGSRAHGTNVSRSDVDVRGLYIPDRKNLISPYAEDASFSLPGDIVFWEVRHFINQIIACNPNALEVLWAPEDSILHAHPAWDALASRREMLLTRRVGDSYGGYAKDEIRRLMKKLDDPEHDPYNARKSAAHIVRLLRMAHEALAGEGLMVRRHADSEELIAYKMGVLPIEHALAEATRLQATLRDAKANTALPETVSKDVVVNAASEMIQGFWAHPPIPVTGLLRKVMGLTQPREVVPTTTSSLQGRAVLVDIEGAGHSAQGVRDMVEIALLEIVDGVPTGNSFYSRLRPDRKPTSFAKRLHGIRWPDVRDSPRIEDIHHSMRAFIGGSPIIAHAAESDKRMLSADLQVAGLPLLENKWLCTARLYAAAVQKLKGKEKRSISLDGMCDALGVDRLIRQSRLHGAMLDADLTAECMKRMLAMGDVPLSAWQVTARKKTTRRVKGKKLQISVFFENGRGYVSMLDGQHTVTSELPDFDARSHKVVEESNRVAIRRISDGRLDNPMGACLVYWREGVAWTMSKEGDKARHAPLMDCDCKNAPPMGGMTR